MEKNVKLVLADTLKYHLRKLDIIEMRLRRAKYCRLNLYLRPLLGNRFIEETSAPELLYVLRRIEKKGFYETAHRCLGIYGQISRFAIASGVVAHDLSFDLKDALHPVVNKGHFASLRDPQDIGYLLLKLDMIPSPYVMYVMQQNSKLIQWLDLESFGTLSGLK